MDKKNIHNLLTEYSFVVPEIQREYVWGATKNKRILQQFLEDLDIKLGKGNANIGFLYSYNSGAENYLIDGQQRFTTILLLLYFLAVRNGEESYLSFINILRLNSNLQAFSYRVRSYTESFLQNLLMSATINPKDVADLKWFKKEYKNDPTINAMLGALEVFETIIDKTPNLTFDKVLNKVFFWYFDVEQTTQGEELYITMNSRGEKLTDSEQIKPRLLRKEMDKKEFYGKRWDEWEEFFYNKKLRGNRGIETIDDAMNNIIRIVLELKTLGEHTRIKPAEDANLISLADIDIYMKAVDKIASISDGKYIQEVARLYGDSSTDQNFYVLKALLTEQVKGQQDLYEYEKVYQTVLNQVRRNKLNNISFLNFLNEYKNSPNSWYDFIIANKDNVINGHELQKIIICKNLGKDAEKAIWSIQEKPFWNGEIKQLCKWATNNEIFSLNEFIRICNNFNLLFDQGEKAGWTSDAVRQALITLRMSDYPYENKCFGYYAYEWKNIIQANQEKFLHFLNEFDNMDKQLRNVLIQKKKDSYPEIPENKWAEFVHHDYLLAYCNYKHIQFRNEYGIECVQNQYKKPYSVMNMHLKHFLENHQFYLDDWSIREDLSGWKSTIIIENPNIPYSLHIQYRLDANKKFVIIFHNKYNKSEESSFNELNKNALKYGFSNDNEILKLAVDSDYNKLLETLKRVITISCSN